MVFPLPSVLYGDDAPLFDEVQLIGDELVLGVLLLGDLTGAHKNRSPPPPPLPPEELLPVL